MATKAENITDLQSCLNKAGQDEPVFILRAKDPLAAAVVAAWAALAMREGIHEQGKIDGALGVAKAMRDWRKIEVAFNINDLTMGAECGSCGFKYRAFDGHIIPCPRCALELTDGMRRAIVQPNPGWGALCESCVFRFAKIDGESFPCDRWGEMAQPAANLARYSRGGRDVTITDGLGREFVEICSAFSPRRSEDR